MTPSDFARTREPESPSLPGGVSGAESTRSTTTSIPLKDTSTAAKKSGETSCDTSSDGMCAPREQPLPQPPSATSRRQASGKRGSSGRVRNLEAEKAARIARCGLTLGSCGKVAEQARRSVGVFRKVLEQCVLQAHGVIAIPAVLAINTAARWELHAQMTTAFLRRDEATLSASERLAHSAAIANAATQRDKAVERLRLPGSTVEASGGTLADFYASLEQQAQQASSEPEKPTSTAPTPTEPNGPALVRSSPPTVTVPPAFTLCDPDEV